MASQTLTSILGSGGGFAIREASKLISIPSGQTGTYITITPPSGQRVRLTTLFSATLQTNQTTISVGGNAIVSGALLETATSPISSGSDEFRVGGDGVIIHQMIEGGTDEAIEISTDVATSSNTIYSYQVGL